MIGRQVKDRWVVVSIVAFYAICKAAALPGQAAKLAATNYNNPIFYADRYALPNLYPTDLWSSYQRAVYPFVSLVYAVPALLWKYVHIPPVYPTWLIVSLNDLLIVLAVYWLSRSLSFGPLVGLLTGFFTVTSQVLSWSLNGYTYLGHENGYAGSFVIPFAIGVIPALIQGRVGIALVLAALAIAIYPPWGVVSIGVIALWLLRRDAVVRRRGLRFAVWPALALAAALASQWLVASSIQHTASHAQDYQVVMVNGHFVPPWAHGLGLGSPNFGFLFFLVLGVLAVGGWRSLRPEQKQPIVALSVMMGASLVGWGVAYRLGWLFALRTDPLRNLQILELVWTPMVVAYLARRASETGLASVAAFALFVVLVIDRGTAWVLPLIAPAVAVLALMEAGRRGQLPAVLRPNGVVARTGVVLIGITFAAMSVDILLGVPFVGRSLALIAPMRGVARVLAEAGRRMKEARPELVLLAVVAAGGIVLRRSRSRGQARGAAPLATAVLAAFMVACVVARSAAAAVSWVTGEPAALQDIETWARESTPVSAMFIFFELDAQGQQLSWQTLSQRGTATLQYTPQKAYASDERLFELDRGVSALYGFALADVNGKPYPYDVFHLYEFYKHFTVADFLRVGRLSGAQFVVLRRPRALPFPVAFQNSRFTAYRVPVDVGGVRVVIDKAGGRRVTVTWTGVPRDGAPRALTVALWPRGSTAGVNPVCRQVLDRPSGEFDCDVPRTLQGGVYLPVVHLDGPQDQRSEDAAWEYVRFD